MGESETSKTVVRGIIFVLILIIIFALLFLFAPKLFGFIQGLNYNEEQKKDSENKFDIFYQRIDECKNFKDTNCRCELFADFPATLLPGYGVLTEDRGVKDYFLLFIDKPEKKVKEAEVSASISFGIVDYLTKNSMIFTRDFYAKNLFNEDKKIIKFTKAQFPNMFFYNKDKTINENFKPAVFSGWALKTEDDIILFALSEQIKKSEKLSQKDLEDLNLKNLIETIPLCQLESSRTRAIEIFNSVQNALNSDEKELLLDFPSDYSIIVSGDVMTLFYKDAPLNRITMGEKKWEESKDIDFKRTGETEFMLESNVLTYNHKSSILCDTHDKTLIQGNVLGFKELNGKKCIALLK